MCSDYYKKRYGQNFKQSTKKVRKWKQSFRNLLLKETSIKEMKRLFRLGGFLGALLGPIISVLGSLFGGATASST